jgi:glycosyltransferase involved in cell wall biosynthesis
VRMYNLMREAAKEFAQVLVVFADELVTPAAELLGICAEIVVVRRRGTHLLPSSERPDVVEEHDTPEFRAALGAVLQKWRPGVVQLEFTQMGAYAGMCGDAKTVLVEHDITLDLYGQLLAEREDYDTRKQWEKWERFERAVWGEVDAVVAMSEKDRRTVGRENAVAILNGVDLSRFQPLGEAGDARRLLFIGSFAHLPNVMALEWFLREVWGLLQGFTLHVIAGQRHAYFLAHYADRVRLDLDREGVEVEGFVSDVRGAYGRAGIVVAPLVASAGTNIKIMEAMAMERAIVTTPAGINGLELHDGVEVAVASNGAEMAAAIERLAGDEAARRAMAARARAAAVERYGWEGIGRKQAALYSSLLGKETIHW